MGCGVDVQRSVDIPAPGYGVLLFHVPVQAIGIRVRPHTAAVLTLRHVPRQLLQHLAAPGKTVQRKAPFQQRVVF